MKSINDLNLTELTAESLSLIDGGKMSLNEARLVAYLIGGPIGLLFFEIGRNS